MDFKLAVELSKLSQVIAYTHEVDDESLEKLHAKCVEEVRRINGVIGLRVRTNIRGEKNRDEIE